MKAAVAHYSDIGHLRYGKEVAKKAAYLFASITYSFIALSTMTGLRRMLGNSSQVITELGTFQ